MQSGQLVTSDSVELLSEVEVDLLLSVLPPKSMVVSEKFRSDNWLLAGGLTQKTYEGFFSPVTELFSASSTTTIRRAVRYLMQPGG